MESNSASSDVSYFGALSMVTCTILDMFSQNHVQASSCAVLQIFGNSERRAASMQALNWSRLTEPSVYLESLRARTSVSSLMRSEFFTFMTRLSHESMTVPIQAVCFLLTPITAALMENISWKVLGMPCFVASDFLSTLACDMDVLGLLSEPSSFFLPALPLPFSPCLASWSESASVEVPEPESLVSESCNCGTSFTPLSSLLFSCTAVQLSIRMSNRRA
mmetsp:Transcript_28454/g.71948  ORF Transcript_28454/g.71948 Transcript_28454/m.71948 type:complete len:220 (+) Transcript_28454:662-1321(+)